MANMKTIYLLRHAKSDWNASYGGDHERPLNGRGKRAATDMGAYLASHLEAPDTILCSTAKRTKETIHLVVKDAKWDTPIYYKEELYLCSVSDVKRQLMSLSNETKSVLLVGHQPTTGEVAGWLTGDFQLHVPTCTFMAINIHVQEWSEIGPGAGILDLHITPKLIQS